MSQYYQLLLSGYQKINRTKDEEIAYGQRDAIFWDHLEDFTDVLPEYAEKAQDHLLLLLGYQPQASSYIPYEHFLRQWIQRFENGNVAYEEFIVQTVKVGKGIRTHDMMSGGAGLAEPFVAGDYAIYDTQHALFKQKAHDRLTSFLGYEPEVEYSLYAEVWLRNFFLHDWFHEEKAFGPWDYRAATIYGFRRALLEGGLEAARNAPLYGRFLRDNN